MVDVVKTSDLHRQAHCWRMVEQLRAAEGDAVTIVCDNPDLGGPNNIVRCIGDWTGWEEETYPGSTIAEALTAALAARRKTTDG